MEISRSTRVRAVPDQVSSDLGEEVVILNLESGKYHGLEDVGARIWELARESRTAGDIEEALLAEYDVEPEQCWRDLTNLLHGLADRGLVEIDDAPAA